MQYVKAKFFEQYMRHFFGFGFVAFKVGAAAVAACLHLPEHVSAGDLMAVVAVVGERERLAMHSPCAAD